MQRTIDKLTAANETLKINNEALDQLEANQSQHNETETYLCKIDQMERQMS